MGGYSGGIHTITMLTVRDIVMGVMFTFVADVFWQNVKKVHFPDVVHAIVTTLYDPKTGVNIVAAIVYFGLVVSALALWNIVSMVCAIITKDKVCRILTDIQQLDAKLTKLHQEASDTARQIRCDIHQMAYTHDNDPMME